MHVVTVIESSYGGFCGKDRDRDKKATHSLVERGVVGRGGKIALRRWVGVCEVTHISDGSDVKRRM
jgi:hypothetical protein